jgi:hypothetical protein
LEAGGFRALSALQQSARRKLLVRSMVGDSHTMDSREECQLAGEAGNLQLRRRIRPLPARCYLPELFLSSP